MQLECNPHIPHNASATPIQSIPMWGHVEKDDHDDEDNDDHHDDENEVEYDVSKMMKMMMDFVFFAFLHFCSVCIASAPLILQFISA